MQIARHTKFQGLLIHMARTGLRLFRWKISYKFVCSKYLQTAIRSNRRQMTLPSAPFGEFRCTSAICSHFPISWDVRITESHAVSPHRNNTVLPFLSYARLRSYAFEPLLFWVFLHHHHQDVVCCCATTGSQTRSQLQNQKPLFHN